MDGETEGQEALCRKGRPAPDCLLIDTIVTLNNPAAELGENSPATSHRCRLRAGRDPPAAVVRLCSRPRTETRGQGRAIRVSVESHLPPGSRRGDRQRRNVAPARAPATAAGSPRRTSRVARRCARTGCNLSSGAMNVRRTLDPSVNTPLIRPPKPGQRETNGYSCRTFA